MIRLLSQGFSEISVFYPWKMSATLEKLWLHIICCSGAILYYCWLSRHKLGGSSWTWIYILSLVDRIVKMEFYRHLDKYAFFSCCCWRFYICFKPSFSILISTALQSRLIGCCWQGRNTSLCDEWACQISDSLIMSIDSKFNLTD